ncbi:hypothetical protein GGI35DRAFT_408057 [Trichoderma velutinum]
MPVCLTVSARRLLDAMNGRDALPSHLALQFDMLQPGRPPLLFFLFSSLSSAVWRAWLAQKEKRTKGPGDGGAAGRTGHIVVVVFLNVHGRGFMKSRVVCCRRGDDGER